MERARGPRPHPVTLNCSGGISLGAYMAGVFTELVKASLRQHAGTGVERIRIDTITGASAGAMTGLIAARTLLQDPDRSLAELADDRGPDRPDDPEREPRNRFFQAWVRQADIRRLVDYRAEERALEQATGPGLPPRTRLALLSGTSIEAIATAVAGAWTPGDLPGMRRALEQRSLALLMTATNLQGVLRASVCGPLTVSHAETRRFLFHRSMQGLSDGDLGDLSLRWSKAIQSARASGAFPAAFPPLSNDSSPSSINLNLDPASEALYRDEARRQTGTASAGDPDRVCWLEAPAGGADPATAPLRLRFDYTDGGVLDGLPILKGIGLLNQLAALQPGTPGAPPAPCPPAPGRSDGAEAAGDAVADGELQAFAHEWFRPEPPEEPARRFVYVQPIPVTDLRSSSSLLRRFFGVLAVALAGLTNPKEEHDHLRLEEIERINRMVQRRDDLIREAASEAEVERLRQALPYREVQLDPIDPVLIFRSADFRTLLLQEAEKVMSQPAGAVPGSEAEALERFETLLGKRAPGPAPSGGTPPAARISAADLLASDFLGAFGGFFQERYRRHDYLIGRLSGLAWLQGLDPRGTDPQLRQEVNTLVQRARSEYLPREERSGLRVPGDVLRLLRLVAVRLPYVLLNDVLASTEGPHRPLPAWQRRLLREVIAPLLAIVALLVLAPLLALLVAVVWLLAEPLGL